MKQPIGICEWSLPVSGPLAIKMAKEAGYDGIQIGEAGGRLMGYPLNNPMVQKAYTEAAQQCGLILHSLNLGALLSEGNLNFSADTEQGKNARRSLDKGFEACHAMNISAVVITVNSEGEEQFENVISHLEYAYELAKKYNVEITVESAQPLPEILKIIDRMGDKIKICMDLLNPLRFCTGVPQEQIRAFGKDRIGHFHMKDSTKDLFRLGQRGCVLLGTGDAGLQESVEIIEELGIENCWMITENYYYLAPMNDGDQDFFKLAAADCSTLKEWFR